MDTLNGFIDPFSLYSMSSFIDFISNKLFCKIFISMLPGFFFQNTTKPKNRCTFHFRGSSAATAYAAGMISHVLREKYVVNVFFKLWGFKQGKTQPNLLA